MCFEPWRQAMKERTSYGSQMAERLMGLDGLCEPLSEPPKLPWVVALRG